MNAPNGGMDLENKSFFVPRRYVELSILKTIQQSGTDLCSIRSRDEFEKKYQALLQDCSEVHEKLAQIADVYVMFLNREKIDSDPFAGPWARNAILCGLLKNASSVYGDGAYHMMESTRSC